MYKFAKYAPVTDFPNKRGTALQLGVSTKKNGEVVGTVEMTVQVKPKPTAGSKESIFDWKNKIFMQINDLEIGKIITVMTGRAPEGKIVHKFPTDAAADQQTVSSIDLKFNGETGDVWFGVQQKRAGEKDFAKCGLFIKPEEVEVIIVLLRAIIGHIYDVNTVNQGKVNLPSEDINRGE